MPFFPIILAGIIETVGSLLLLVGLYTRATAFVLSGEMAVAYFMIRPSRSFFPLTNLPVLPVRGWGLEPRSCHAEIGQSGVTPQRFGRTAPLSWHRHAFSLTGELVPDFRPSPHAVNGERMSAWFSRLKREYEAGNLPAKQYLVLCELGRFGACRFGVFPSHATLAARARCGLRTVQRALQVARRLGLVAIGRPPGSAPRGAACAGPTGMF
jgi:hypothetical protein